MARWPKPGRLVCAVLTAALTTMPAKAGQVEVQHGKTCVISIAGHIEDGDDKTFDDLATGCPNALVV